MAVFYLPGAQDDLASLQDYMLAKWDEALCDQALDEIYSRMSVVDHGKRHGVPVVGLLELGIEGYQATLTSHHRVIYKRIDQNTYIYIVAGQRQDFSQVLEKRLMQMI